MSAPPQNEVERLAPDEVELLFPGATTAPNVYGDPINGWIDGSGWLKYGVDALNRLWCWRMYYLNDKNAESESNSLDAWMYADGRWIILDNSYDQLSADDLNQFL